MKKYFCLIGLSLLIFSTSFSQESSNSNSFPLTSSDGLTLINVVASQSEYKEQKGIRVMKDKENVKDETLVILDDILFENGVIELELAGKRLEDTDKNMRGFVGLAFHIDTSDYHSYECFYLRPENGRAEDQLRRNHSVQYINHPDFPWHILREESPGVYESYADLVPGDWTKVKIEVSGKTAKLYVNDAEQPCLIVNDLKLAGKEGGIALWLHASTLAYFRNLKITHINE